MEIPFYEELSVVKTNEALRGYARTYKVELMDKKYLSSKSEASKSSIKDLFNDLLDEIKSFKYKITVKILLIENKNTEIEFSPCFFNLTTKTVINHQFGLEKAFQEILYGIKRSINEGSGWIIESIDSQYINISTFRPLSGS